MSVSSYKSWHLYAAFTVQLTGVFGVVGMESRALYLQIWLESQIDVVEGSSDLMKKKQQGFTLVELIFGLSIIGILAVIAIPVLTVQYYSTRADRLSGLGAKRLPAEEPSAGCVQLAYR
jgi:prepilin-type N-terminal cleavage/methylation domain-containing protein